MICSFPANTIPLNQRWNNVDSQRSSTLFWRWFLFENESWAIIYLSAWFKRWQNNIETTSIELLRWFNNGKLTLFQRWYLVENESWVNVCSLELLQLWENSTETSLSIFVALTFTRKWLNNKTNLSSQV